MSPETLEPREAHARMTATDGSLYLDVRSTPEFDQGHPEGAWNIPLLHSTPQGMQPNPDFLAVAEKVLPRDQLIFVGCKAGGRSAKACQVLASVGFEQLVNVMGGYGGATDPATGQVVVPGWEACGLPTASAPEEGRSWPELRGRALDT